MMLPATGAVCAAISQARRIHVGDVLALRHSLLPAKRATRREAESLFDLARENLPACAQWREFFIEAIAACLFSDEAPGQLTEEDAEWLIAMIERSSLDEGLEFDLAGAVMRKTQCCPSVLMRFVLRRLNELSERATSSQTPAPGLEAARSALQAAGLAGRLYVPRKAPDAASVAA